MKETEDPQEVNELATTQLPGLLLPGDLHLDGLGLGFDETAGARRTLEFHDPVLSCGCPADCIQHPWGPM